MAVARHAAQALPRPPAAERATVDLHSHTTRSDGVLEPRELVAQAAAAGIRTLAITDHDSLAAVRELTAAAAEPLPAGLELLPGVEINAVTTGRDFPDAELHILGFGVDPSDDAFEATLRAQRGARRRRFEVTVARLRELGLPIDEQVARLDRESDDALGRPTIARALVAAGHVTDVQDAFERLLSWGRPAYVPREGLGPREAIRAIRDAGGVPVLAHYAEADDRVSVLRQLREVGLAGLESHHRSFDDATRAIVGAVARDLGFLETGGTDYHGDLGPYAEVHEGFVFPADLAATALAAIATIRRSADRP